ncbi:VIT family-domain-containing protein [Cladochytrium replicatum]|nr:VIT family-domain-containing protein [Cladochytrium replicatum]
MNSATNDNPHLQTAASTTTIHIDHAGYGTVDVEPAQIPVDTDEAVLVGPSNLVPNPHNDKEHGHQHFSHRKQWLRAALLGANDGLVSIASIFLGVSGASDDHRAILLAAVAGLSAGAFSMACGEYVSVAGQKDSETADWLREKAEFLKGPEYVEREIVQLAQVYVDKGLSPQVALLVARDLHANSSSLDEIVKIHMRDELAIDMGDLAKPVQAAVTSALTFVAGGVLPVISGAFIYNPIYRLLSVVLVTVFSLIIFGVLGAHLGGSPLWKGALRMAIGGGLAMGATYGIGVLFNVAVS